MIAAVALAAATGPLGWNAILRAAHGREFFTDAPIAVLPASWQDAGSGMFALAAAAILLGYGPLAMEHGRRVATTGLVAGITAFLVDAYLY